MGCKCYHCLIKHSEKIKLYSILFSISVWEFWRHFCPLNSLEHSINLFPIVKAVHYQRTVHAVTSLCMWPCSKTVKHRSCALFGYRALHDAISFSNCTKELSFASFFCTAVWKLNDVIPCSITEQCTFSHVLTVLTEYSFVFLWMDWERMLHQEQARVIFMFTLNCKLTKQTLSFVHESFYKIPSGVLQI